MNKRNIGASLEGIAAKYIEDKGGTVIERNFRCKGAEIDIIARDDKYICFVEVKYRKNNKYGGPQAAVNYAKRQKICMASGYFLLTKGLDESTPIRYDVIAILGDENSYKINWIKNAFEYAS